MDVTTKPPTQPGTMTGIRPRSTSRAGRWAARTSTVTNARWFTSHTATRPRTTAPTPRAPSPAPPPTSATTQDPDATASDHCATLKALFCSEVRRSTAVTTAAAVVATTACGPAKANSSGASTASTRVTESTS